MKHVKVAIWGFGAMGSGIAKTLLGKQGVEIVGICDNHPERIGKGMFAVLGIDAGDRPEVMISENIEDAVREGACDICVIATNSFVKDIIDKVLLVLKKKVNVITLAEEMAYPQAKYPGYSAEMDRVARENGVSVMGTGINPGLVMDLLAICLSGAMTDVKSVFCRRVNSLSPFGATVMEEQGVGLTVEEFEKGVKDGTLAGHVGFAESVGMISEALGLGVDSFEQSMSPIVTELDRQSQYAVAKAGDVAGVDMSCKGFRKGELVISMEHPQQIEPEAAGVATGDYIDIAGTPAVSMSIRPEISGGAGTIAMCVNCIPHVINARPGLRTMIDIPVPHAIMGDFRDLVDPDKKIVK